MMWLDDGIDDSGDTFHGMGSAPSGGYRDSATVRAVQQKLAELAANLDASNPAHVALDPGGVDGIYGPHTAAAVRALEGQGNQAQTGEIDDWVIAALGVDAPSAPLNVPRSTPAPGAPPPAGTSSSGSGRIILGVLAGVAALLLGRRKLSRRRAAREARASHHAAAWDAAHGPSQSDYD